MIKNLKNISVQHTNIENFQIRNLVFYLCDTRAQGQLPFIVVAKMFLPFEDRVMGNVSGTLVNFSQKWKR